MRQNHFPQNPKKVIETKNISMTDDIFLLSQPEKNEKTFLNGVKKCPICNVNTFQDFRDHVQERHQKTSPLTIEKYIENEINQMRPRFDSIRALHHMLMVQGSNGVTITPKEKQKYAYLINELRNLVEISFNNTDV